MLSGLFPILEKMLYDQALMAIAYTEIYQATGKEEYAKAAREILEYVLRDMTSLQGGFFLGRGRRQRGRGGQILCMDGRRAESIAG